MIELVGHFYIGMAINSAVYCILLLLLFAWNMKFFLAYELWNLGSASLYYCSHGLKTLTLTNLATPLTIGFLVFN